MATDWVGLRQLVDRAVAGLDVHSHRHLETLCPQLGLPPLPAQGTLTKRERLQVCLQGLGDEDLPAVARRILADDQVFLAGAERFALQDALWATGPVVEVPGRVRREIAHSLVIEPPLWRHDRFERMLDQLWVLDDPFSLFAGSPNSLRALVARHVFRNPGDWSTDELFEQLGAYEAGHARFGRFLEALLDPATLPDAPEQNRLAEAFNAVLTQAGARLEPTEERDGYPCFRLVRTGGAPRRPRNLIFASSVKPDIRFLSALDNDIEVLQSRDQVLHYDRPTGPQGIRWCDLQQWWQDTTGIDAKDAKDSLYNRLGACLPPETISPQVHLFRLYHQIHGAQVWHLPALLPEVWLHWDHKTVRRRGVNALLNHRMDFLMLLPNGRRVVLEVDGRHHYKDGKTYADTVRGDRDLKLRGYDVYRFGSTELSHPEQAQPLLERFFADLFDHYEARTTPDPA